jgi:hypothetical protein
MRKDADRPSRTEIEPEGGGIAAAITQDIELTAEQIKEAAHKAVVAVEKKIAGLTRSRPRKPAKKTTPVRPRAKTKPAKRKTGQGKTTGKAKTKKTARKK